MAAGGVEDRRLEERSWPAAAALPWLPLMEKAHTCSAREEKEWNGELE